MARTVVCEGAKAPYTIIGQAGFYPPPVPRHWRGARAEVSARHRVCSCHRHSQPTPPLLRGRVFESRCGETKKGGRRWQPPFLFIGQAGFYPPPVPRHWRGARAEVSARHRVCSCHRHSQPTPPLLRGRVFESRCGETKKGGRRWQPPFFVYRASGIRTHDPLHPMQVRYQTALLPENLVFVCLAPCGVSTRRVYMNFYSCQEIFFMI